MKKAKVKLTKQQEKEREERIDEISEKVGSILAIPILILLIYLGVKNSMAFCEKNPETYFKGSHKVEIDIEYLNKILKSQDEATIYIDKCMIGKISEGQKKVFYVNLEDEKEYVIKIKTGLLVDDKETFYVSNDLSYLSYSFKSGEITDTKRIHGK